MNALTSKDQFTPAAVSLTPAGAPVANQDVNEPNGIMLEQTAAQSDQTIFSTAFAHIPPGKLPDCYPGLRFK